MASLSMAASVGFPLLLALPMNELPAISWLGTIGRLVTAFLLVLAGGALGRNRNLADAGKARATAG